MEEEVERVKKEYEEKQKKKKEKEKEKKDEKEDAKKDKKEEKPAEVGHHHATHWHLRLTVTRIKKAVPLQHQRKSLVSFLLPGE